jgi:hypothetical protein
MKNWRRYEILLPLQFNDGTPVPKGFLADAVLELDARFGAVSCETQVIQGRWRFEGKSFKDDLMRIYVDVEDTRETRDFFSQFKLRTKSRFQQLDIWITTHSIEVI